MCIRDSFALAELACVRDREKRARGVARDMRDVVAVVRHARLRTRSTRGLQQHQGVEQRGGERARSEQRRDALAHATTSLLHVWCPPIVRCELRARRENRGLKPLLLGATKRLRGMFTTMLRVTANNTVNKHILELEYIGVLHAYQRT